MRSSMRSTVQRFAPTSRSLRPTQKLRLSAARQMPEQVQPSLRPDAELVDRFRTNLDAIVAPNLPVGLAVSGGPDSLALLLLAAAARPGLVEAATVDHALRPESRAEAETVATLCGKLDISHAILTA